MRHYQDYASAACLTRSSPEMLDCRSEEPDELRTRAARYRILAETLLDPRVIAVAQACARELETEAIAIQTADHSWNVKHPDQARR